jgi:hypothetical protein
MNSMFHLLLEHPERFIWSEIPCCLLGLLDAETDERLSRERLRDTSPATTALDPHNVCDGLSRLRTGHRVTM